MKWVPARDDAGCIREIAERKKAHAIERERRRKERLTQAGEDLARLPDRVAKGEIALEEALALSEGGQL